MTEQTPPSTRTAASSHKVAVQRQRALWVAWAAAGVALVLALALVGVIIVGTLPVAPKSAIDVMPGINRTSATVLQLDPMTGTLLKAPAFSLTDQNGHQLTLSQFAGKSVVLTFDDDECTDLCTLLAQDVVAANRDLAGAVKNVVFVAINANARHPQVSAVKSWTDSHGLGNTHNWFFGTADPAMLSRVWAQYGVPVDVDASTGGVTHGAEIFFIGPSGYERALGQFGTESADTAVFAHTMAQAAVDLLPNGSRRAVAGPEAIPAQHGGSQIGATPAAISLPLLSEAGSTFSTSTDAGKYQVVNFWSSTCTACVSELPELQTASKNLGSTVAFVGIDVSDAPDAGRSFARRAGMTYPQLADASGSVAGRFHISGLPYTVILDPDGKVVIRHPGTFTAEQLEYVVRSLDWNLGSVVH